MKGIPIVVGTTLIILGLILANFGVYEYTAEVPKTETNILFSNISISGIGDYAVKDIDLRQNSIANLQGEISAPGSSTTSSINLFVMNNNEYQKWKNGDKKVEYILSREKVERFNETFLSPQNGTYYIVFDNTQDPNYKKEVTLSAKYTYEIKVQEKRRDETLTQLGYPLSIIGAIILVYGLLSKHPTVWDYSK